MTTEKIYGTWTKWEGGECPLPPDTLAEVKLRNGTVREPSHAPCYRWYYLDNPSDIVEYRTVTEPPDLEAAEKLLRDNGYTVTPPPKQLTFEDVEPLTEAPPEGTEFWVVSASTESGVYRHRVDGNAFPSQTLKRRMAYLKKEHALIAARHIFGLKGGEL